MDKVIYKYKCGKCGWEGDILGDKETEDGDIECCMHCDSDEIIINNLPCQS